MKIGLVGLPGSGKTTCFRILSGQAGVDSRHGAQLATVTIPDARLDGLFEVEKANKKVCADVTFMDFEALHKGAASSGELGLHTVAGDVDAFALVIQCFGDLDHLGNPLDPKSDLEALFVEMSLSDLRIMEKHLERLHEGPKSDRPPKTVELMERCIAHLGQGSPLRELQLSEDGLRYLKGFTPLTMMPFLVVCNVAEDDLQGQRVVKMRNRADAVGVPHIMICAELEEELAQLPEEDRKDFLAEYGLQAPARDRFILACSEVLDLVTFFTVNENEARAWTVPRDTPAPEAAGKVHTDMQEGFIRAEVTSLDHFHQQGSLQACKDKGYTRVEGKDYVVQDGDILQIRFSR